MSFGIVVPFNHEDVQCMMPKPRLNGMEGIYKPIELSLMYKPIELSLMYKPHLELSLMYKPHLELSLCINHI